MDIYLELSKRNVELKSRITRLKRKLSSLPEGTLGYYIVNGYPRFYRCIGRKKTYLGLNNQELIRKLVMKDYCLRKLKEYEAEFSANEAYLKTRLIADDTLLKRLSDPQYLKYLENCPGVTDLPPSKEEMAIWMHAPYETNPAYPENLKYRSLDGTYMRSKSETGIAAVLSRHNIAYRYECRLDIGNSSIYPDFTILHPKTGEQFLWEHFGMLDKDTYRRSMFKREETYIKNGYYPGVNLIYTWESDKHPLDLTYVENLVNFYFE